MAHLAALRSPSGELISTARAHAAEPTWMGFAAALREIGQRRREGRDHEVWSVLLGGRRMPDLPVPRAVLRGDGDILCGRSRSRGPLRDWCRLAGTTTTYIEPGSPWENPFVGDV
jgi:hypothetical protein